MMLRDARLWFLRGAKIDHLKYSTGEWVKSSPDGKKVLFEDGLTLPVDTFWKLRESIQWRHNWVVVGDPFTSIAAFRFRVPEDRVDKVMRASVEKDFKYYLVKMALSEGVVYWDSREGIEHD